MKPLSEVFIPKNYMDELPKLKDKYFAWKMQFSSKTDVANTGQITHYEIRDAESRGNFVLVPGLASNTEIEPLMRAITYWSLTHKYNIYAIDSFLGEFRPGVSVELASKNTLSEFMDLMDAGLEIVSKMSAGDKWTCMIGHSLGGAGVLEVFNRRVLQKKPISFSGAILFAPFAAKGWNDFTKSIIKSHQYPNISNMEFDTKPIGLFSPHDAILNGGGRFVSIYPVFYDEIDALMPRPDLMAQYNIPVTLVVGGLDKKSPIEYIRGIYNDVRKYTKGKNIEFVEFPKSKHSFMNQHNDRDAILRLIKTQYVRAKKSNSK